MVIGGHQHEAMMGTCTRLTLTHPTLIALAAIMVDIAGFQSVVFVTLTKLLKHNKFRREFVFAGTKKRRDGAF